MKICYVLDFFIFEVDGPTINEQTFLKSLQSQDNVEVFYFISDDNRSFLKFQEKEVCFFKSYSKKKMSCILFYALLTFFKFILFYFRTKPDLIITRLGPVPFLQYFISFFLGKKFFIKTVGRFWVDSQKLSLKEKFVSKSLILLNKKILHNSRAFDTVTQKFMDIFVLHYRINANKIAIIENAVDITKFFPKKNKIYIENDFSKYFPILGYVGNLPSKRGADHLLKIYKPIKEIYPNAAVIIVGIDKEIGCLRTKSLGLDHLEAFFCLGQIPYASIPEIINVIDIGYSFTTQHDLQELGNSSQKLRQYISCGKPVITMKTTNNFVETENLGSLVDQENTREILDETLKWIKIIEEEGDALSRRLHQYAKDHLSTDKTFKQRLEFWQSILNNEK